MKYAFTPIFVILMVSLFLECLSLLLYDFGMALCLRLIVMMLLYLAFIIKREITLDRLKHRKFKLLKPHQYIIPCVCLVSTLFHLIMLMIVPFRLYSALIVLSTLPVALDEYQEIQWLRMIQSTPKEHQLTEIQLRPSIYYTYYMHLNANKESIV